MKNFDLLNIILKWKKTLGVVALIAIVFSAVFSSSFFIKPKYRSTAIIYPSNLTPYSQETPTEQMLQLFQSDSIFNHLLNHFNLIQHYNLDSTNSTIHYQLLTTYAENVSIKKTEYEAVKIDVLDENPEIACEMINEMVKAFNAYTLKLNQQKYSENVTVFDDRMKIKQQQIDSINKALKELAVQFGLIDYSAQSRELSKAYYLTLATGNEKKISELTISLRNLEERGGKFHELQGKLAYSTNEYSEILANKNKAISDVKKYLTYTNMVVKPFPSDKKAYPIRWLIVTISTLAALFFSLIVILIIEGKQYLNIRKP